VAKSPRYTVASQDIFVQSATGIAEKKEEFKERKTFKLKGNHGNKDNKTGT
jgi:hypothetical protein